jgi:hypothetical protein
MSEFDPKEVLKTIYGLEGIFFESRYKPAPALGTPDYEDEERKARIMIGNLLTNLPVVGQSVMSGKLLLDVRLM